MDILNKKKVGGGGGQTDYVFHFHFALCLNKQFLTALFSKPTFSQLLSGTTERESNAQDVQGLLDFAHSFYSAISALATQATGRAARNKQQPWRDWLASQQISTGRVHSDPHTMPGRTPAFCQAFVTGPSFATGTDPLPSTEPQGHRNLEDDSEQQLREEARENSSYRPLRDSYLQHLKTN